VTGLTGREFERILVRGTNWVGDAVMTLPALTALKGNFPKASLIVLAKKWVAPVYADHPGVDRVMIIDKEGPHKGLGGLWRLAREIRRERFELAVLFQNAFEAALITRLAGVPLRLGYDTDARGLLLNLPIRLRPEDKQVHETEYYLRILERAGLDAPYSRPVYRPNAGAENRADARLRQLGLSEEFLVGLAPGAAYGPAKQWPPERFAAAADLVLKEHGGAALVFGGPGDTAAAKKLIEAMTHRSVDLTGQTDLSEAAALIRRCRLFLTNDSGLMHLAAAVDTPLVAVFGSTNPVTTSPAGSRQRLIRRETPCSPCMKTHCDRPVHECMERIGPEEVARAGLELLNADEVKTDE
jgi:heptosyltransferase-2